MARRIITHREQVEALGVWHPHLRVAAHEPHPDLAFLLSLLGCVHTTGGRRIDRHHHLAALTPEEQEARLADQAGGSKRSIAPPVRAGQETDLLLLDRGAHTRIAPSMSVAVEGVAA